MNRQEFLINLTLLTVIGALVYTILESGSAEDDLLNSVSMASVTKSDEDASDGKVESPFKKELDNYPSFGKKPLFQALITPTPSPAPPTPTPTPTPDINAATSNLKVTSIMDGIVIIEPRKPDPVQFPDGMKEMRVGEAIQVDIGKGEKKPLQLKAVDEKTDMSNPSATFMFQDNSSNEAKVFRLFEDAAPGP